jgi:hypothetical protein
LRSLPTEAPVHAGIEARTMRRVHDVLDTERRWRPWRLVAQWLPAPALAALAVVVVLSWWPATSPSPAPVTVASVARETPPAAPATRPARPVAAPAAPSPGAGRTESAPGPERMAPPPELAGALEMYLDLPILENMEKLEHFEVIHTTEMDGEKGHSG